MHIRNAHEGETDILTSIGLRAWQKAMALMEAVYRESARWPSDERFGLTSQIRRAVVSVPGNIAEGTGRSGPAELKHFLSIESTTAERL